MQNYINSCNPYPYLEGISVSELSFGGVLYEDVNLIVIIKLFWACLFCEGQKSRALAAQSFCF